MKRLRNFRAPVFLRLFLAFLCIIVAMYGFSFYISIQSSKNLENELAQSLMVKLIFFQSRLENDIDNISRSIRQYSNKYSLQRLSLAPETLEQYQKIKYILDIHSRLIEIEINNTLIHNISVHIPSLERTISTKNTISVLTSAEYEIILQKYSVNSIFIDNNSDILTMYFYPNKLWIKGEKNPLYTISVDFSKKYIIKQLEELLSGTNGGAVIMDINESWMISSDDKINEIIKNIATADSNLYNDIDDISYSIIDNNKMMILKSYSAYLNTYIFSYMPVDVILSPYKYYSNWIWYLSGFSILIVIIYSYIMYKQYTSPLNVLIHSFKKLEAGNLDIKIKHKSNDEFSYLFKQFNSMTRSINEYIDKIYEQRVLLQSAELKQLQYQIKPHFLYNNMFSIYRMAKDDRTDDVANLALNLGRFYKLMTRNNEEVSPLYEEVIHAKSYVEIQTIRFGKRISVSFDDIPKINSNSNRDVGSLLVPPFILQPLLENAYNHGLENIQKEGKISLSMFVKDNILHIYIEDNGKGMTDEKIQELRYYLYNENKEDENKIGLINVHRRLKLKFGDMSRLQVYKSDLGGMKVEILIPLDTLEENNV